MTPGAFPPRVILTDWKPAGRRGDWSTRRGYPHDIWETGMACPYPGGLLRFRADLAEGERSRRVSPFRERGIKGGLLNSSGPAPSCGWRGRRQSGARPTRRAPRTRWHRETCGIPGPGGGGGPLGNQSLGRSLRPMRRRGTWRAARVFISAPRGPPEGHRQSRHRYLF